jgi:hypothetical protein
MSARLLATAAVILAVATGCGSSSRVTVQRVQSAFGRNGLPLGGCVWQKGETSPSGSDCPAFVNGVRRGQPGYAEVAHQIGYAYTGPVLKDKLKRLMIDNPSAFAKLWAAKAAKGRGAWIYDSSAFAKLAAAQERRHAPNGDAVLVGRNVVYVGPRSAAARRAMKELVDPN